MRSESSTVNDRTREEAQSTLKREVADNLIKIKPLAGLIGAEVDVDLRFLTEDTFQQVHEAFLEYVILVFPHQQLNHQDQEAFARRFGDLWIFPHAPGMKDNTNLLPINMPAGIHRGRWHSDATFDDIPPAISILSARQLPSKGGETAFANQYAAYDALSPGLKKMLAELDAVHDASSHRGAPMYKEQESVHPVLRTHPDTGRTALFVNAEFTRRFDGWTTEESAGLLNYLTNHAHQPEFCYVHRWSEGDVVMWDNRAAQHYPILNRPREEVRRMWRVTVAGDRPSFSGRKKSSEN